MLIKKDNLVIRNATIKDAPLLGKWWRDGNVMEHAGFPLGLLVTDEEIAMDLSKDTDDNRRLIIEVNNIPIGEMSYSNKGDKIAEIGIKICDFSMQEKGYGTKFICMLIGELFEQYGYEKIILDTNMNNKRAQYVYEKIGFRKVKEEIDSWKNQIGQQQSTIFYELSKKDFVYRYQLDCRNYWYAYIYEQQLKQDDEITFILNTIDSIEKQTKKILEVACGGGRILHKLTQANHIIVGFDMDEYMLKRCQMKIKDMDNAKCFYANALLDDWVKDYDVVILAGNILINIITDGDYANAQKLFIQKAAKALTKGGHLYLDFDCYEHKQINQDNQEEWTVFEGTDDRGTYGKFIVVGNEYNPITRMSNNSFRRYEIVPHNSKEFSFTFKSVKHFPNLSLVHNWLNDAGFVIEWEYGGYNRQAIDENIIGNKGIIWARKL